MTNIVFLLPMLVCYLFQNRRAIHLKNFTICFFIAIFPVTLYLTNNYIQTGNPVLPYFNDIFKSCYFPFERFKDYRWGPENVRDFLLWPFYLLFQPTYRQSEIPNPWAIGGLGVAIGTVYYFLNRCIASCRKRHAPPKRVKRVKEKRICTLLIVILSSYILWAFSTGHIRYFILGNIIGGILFVYFLVDLLNSRETQPSINALFRVLAVALTIIFAIGPAVFIVNDLKGRDWSRRSLDDIAYKINVKYIFQDRTFSSISQANLIDAFLINTPGQGALASQINKTVPIYNNEYIHNQLDGQTYQLVNNRVDELFEAGLSVYDVFIPTNEDFETYTSRLNAYGVRLVGLEWLEGIFTIPKGNPILCRVKRLSTGCENTFCYATNEQQNTLLIQPMQKNISLSFCGGVISNCGYFDQNLEDPCLNISIFCANKKIFCDQIPVENEQFCNMDYTLNLNSTDPLQVKFWISDATGSIRYDLNPYSFVIVSTVADGCEISQ